MVNWNKLLFFFIVVIIALVLLCVITESLYVTDACVVIPVNHLQWPSEISDVTLIKRLGVKGLYSQDSEGNFHTPVKDGTYYMITHGRRAATLYSLSRA